MSGGRDGGEPTVPGGSTASGDEVGVPGGEARSPGDGTPAPGDGDGARSAVRLLGPSDVRELAELADIAPTKKLGQNFVIDANTVRRIVRTAKVEGGETVLEVGPGLGSLTLGLLEAGACVIAVEIDGRLAEQLPATVSQYAPEAAGRLTVVHGDALAMSELPADPSRLVANLPYNISVPVLLHVLERFPSIRAGVVMVQAEVGARLAAEPGSKVYGSPSVKASWYGRWRTVGNVGRQVFWPVPNVDSILVQFERHGEEGDPGLRGRVFRLVDAGFQQRRKTLRQSLATVYGAPGQAEAALRAAGIDPSLRAEQLGVEDFVRLAG